MFWVRAVYFNVRNILLKSDTFPPGTPCIDVLSVLVTLRYAVDIDIRGEVKRQLQIPGQPALPSVPFDRRINEIIPLLRDVHEKVAVD